MNARATKLTIFELCDNLRRSEEAVINRLKQEYPKGTWWQVMLSCKQKNPSIMQVQSHEGGRFGIVRFSRDRPLSRYGKWQPPFHKSVSVHSIIGRA